MKKYYDRSNKAQTFSEGEMVLVRKPGLNSKFEDTWEGPYQADLSSHPHFAAGVARISNLSHTHPHGTSNLPHFL